MKDVCLQQFGNVVSCGAPYEHRATKNCWVAPGTIVVEVED